MNIEITARARAFTGQPIGQFLFLVNDLDVKVWDPIAGHFTGANALSKRAKARIVSAATPSLLPIGWQRGSYRFAGHCFSTTYTYPCIEELTPRKRGGTYWKKVSQWGRRARHGGYLHRNTAHILADWGPLIAAHNAAL